MAKYSANQYQENLELIEKWKKLTAILNRRGISPDKFVKHYEIFNYISYLCEKENRTKKESFKIASVKYPFYTEGTIQVIYYSFE